jgi:hypothetical protein
MRPLVQRAPGHLDKPHMHSGGEPMVVPIARHNRLALVRGEGKKIPDLKRREIRSSPRHDIVYLSGELTRPCPGDINSTSTQGRTAPNEGPSMRESQRV